MKSINTSSRCVIVLACCLVLLAALVLNGCKNQTGGKRHKLAFVTNNASDFWTIARKGTEKAAAELPNADQTVRITGLLAEVGGLPAKMLVGELGLRMDQLAVMTLMIYDLLGEEMFKRSFGIPGNLEYCAKFVERAKAADINQDTALNEIGAFVRQAFANAPRAAQ